MQQELCQRNPLMVTCAFWTCLSLAFHLMAGCSCTCPAWQGVRRQPVHERRIRLHDHLMSHCQVLCPCHGPIASQKLFLKRRIGICRRGRSLAPKSWSSALGFSHWSLLEAPYSIPVCPGHFEISLAHPDHQARVVERSAVQPKLAAESSLILVSVKLVLTQL